MIIFLVGYWYLYTKLVFLSPSSSSLLSVPSLQLVVHKEFLRNKYMHTLWGQDGREGEDTGTDFTQAVVLFVLD